MAPQRKYTSVLNDIMHAAQVNELGFTEDEIEEKIWHIYEEICRHVSVHDPELDYDGKQWLAELLAWEELFPYDKDQFLGTRPPSLPKHQHPRYIAPNGLPFCGCCACMSWEQGDLRCPFIRVEKCGKSGHDEFKYRIGTEIEGETRCPACKEDEKKNQEGAGWVFVEKEEQSYGDREADG
ncbi:uncharacterized protein LY89DRAFT_738514 [Mollisia scopiformis]|uniref:Uncharacterized protein n=1 Tax=Mollisia scopiformis TaxID=149040 RepID=A0A194WV76_MOLSC|nr:uncharacterized protein LY89DRAFT_738514 [Mollisia scopiformis]KUJ11871.1 hypothetical protein LY89DRAFT_738514 [Mollisia scopiformis]